MKVINIGLAMAVAGVLASAPVLADKGHDNGKSHSKGKLARAYDVCVDGITGARLTNFPPSAGDRVTAVGMVLPQGTVPADGSGDPPHLP